MNTVILPVTTRPAGAPVRPLLAQRLVRDNLLVAVDPDTWERVLVTEWTYQQGTRVQVRNDARLIGAWTPPTDRDYGLVATPYGSVAYLPDEVRPVIDPITPGTRVTVLQGARRVTGRSRMTAADRYQPGVVLIAQSVDVEHDAAVRRPGGGLFGWVNTAYLIATPEEETPMTETITPTFAEGDRVRIAQHATTALGHWVDPDVFGRPARVVTVATDITVEAELARGGTLTQSVAPQFLTPEPEPVTVASFARGERVRVLPDARWLSFEGNERPFDPTIAPTRTFVVETTNTTIAGNVGITEEGSPDTTYGVMPQYLVRVEDQLPPAGEVADFPLGARVRVAPNSGWLRSDGRLTPFTSPPSPDEVHVVAEPHPTLTPSGNVMILTHDARNLGVAPQFLRLADEPVVEQMLTTLPHERPWQVGDPLDPYWVQRLATTDMNPTLEEGDRVLALRTGGFTNEQRPYVAIVRSHLGGDRAYVDPVNPDDVVDGCIKSSIGINSWVLLEPATPREPEAEPSAPVYMLGDDASTWQALDERWLPHLRRVAHNPGAGRHWYLNLNTGSIAMGNQCCGPDDQGVYDHHVDASGRFVALNPPVAIGDRVLVLDAIDGEKPWVGTVTAQGLDFLTVRRALGSGALAAVEHWLPYVQDTDPQVPEPVSTVDSEAVRQVVRTCYQEGMTRGYSDARDDFAAWFEGEYGLTLELFMGHRYWVSGHVDAYSTMWGQRRVVQVPVPPAAQFVWLAETREAGGNHEMRWAAARSLFPDGPDDFVDVGGVRFEYREAQAADLVTDRSTEQVIEEVLNWVGERAESDDWCPEYEAFCHKNGWTPRRGGSEQPQQRVALISARLIREVSYDTSPGELDRAVESMVEGSIDSFTLSVNFTRVARVPLVNSDEDDDYGITDDHVTDALSDLSISYDEMDEWEIEEVVNADD